MGPRGDHDGSLEYLHQLAVDAQTIARLEKRIEACESSASAMLSGQNEIAENLKIIMGEMKTVADLAQAWGNAKGFWTTVKFIAGAAAIVSALWVFVKTGQWVSKI